MKFLRVVIFCLSFFYLYVALGQKPSLVVVMVDSLSFQDLRCHERWCQDFTKFSRAFTPSTMSQAVVVSLLTAKYPFENQVWHNGDQFLSAEVETLSEKAISQGYRTSFFSGGVPIFKKAGIQQGFEKFHDTPKIQKGQFYIPSGELFDIFLSWFEGVSKKDPFVSFLYLPDLQWGAQKELLVETIKNTFKKVQKNKENVTFVITGLQGKGLPYDLEKEKTRVPLWIHSPLSQKKSVTELVSLVDLGKTFYDFLEIPYTSKNLLKNLPVLSLKPLLQNGPEYNFLNRNILLESSWTYWKQKGVSRFALRKNNYLFLWDKKPRLLEEGLRVRDKQAYLDMKSFFEVLALDPWSDEGVQENKKQRKKEAQAWQAQKDLDERDWKSLFRSKRPEFKFLGAKNLKENFFIPVKGCLMFFFPKTKDKTFHDCEDKLFYKTYLWVKEQKPFQFRQFFRHYWYQKNYQTIMSWNFKNHNQWDVQEVRVPLWSDLYLSLPENQIFLKKVQNEMNKIRALK